MIYNPNLKPNMLRVIQCFYFFKTSYTYIHFVCILNAPCTTVRLKKKKTKQTCNPISKRLTKFCLIIVVKQTKVTQKHVPKNSHPGFKPQE